MEVFNALTALHQCDSSKPTGVVERRYTNTPYIPQGSYSLPYLDVSTLPGGASSTIFPLDQLCVHRLFPFSDTEVVFSQEEGEWGWKCFPISKRLYGKDQKREHNLSNPILLSVPLSAPSSLSRRGHPGGGRIGLPPSPQASTRFQSIQISAGVWVGPRKHKYSLKDMMIGGSKLARRHDRWWALMVKQADATFQEVFSQANLATLSSYCLGASPPQFPSTTWVEHCHYHATGWGYPSYHHCIQAWGLTGSRPLKWSSLSTPKTLPLPVLLLLDIPL